MITMVSAATPSSTYASSIVPSLLLILILVAGKKESALYFTNCLCRFYYTWKPDPWMVDMVVLGLTNQVVF